MSEDEIREQMIAAFDNVDTYICDTPDPRAQYADLADAVMPFIRQAEAQALRDYADRLDARNYACEPGNCQQPGGSIHACWLAFGSLFGSDALRAEADRVASGDITPPTPAVLAAIRKRANR